MKTTKLNDIKFTDGMYDVRSDICYEVHVTVEGQSVELSGSRYTVWVEQGSADYDEVVRDLILDRCSTCDGITVEKVA